MSERVVPPLTGREVDFRKTYFGHDLVRLELDVEPGVHRMAGWCKPLPQVGDVLLARDGLIHGDSTSEQRLLVLEIEYPDELPPGFRALVSKLPAS